ncbi:MAG: hypothetical protein ABSB40_11195 [Nitrososphaeria archaeon]|jgi:hypothetical protein
MSEHSNKVDQIKKVSTECDEHYSFLKETGSSIDSNSLKPRVRNITHSTNVGKKISNFGIALVALPDPIMISDAVGGVLFISGRYMQKKAPIVLKDVFKEFNKVNGELKKARFL